MSTSSQSTDLTVNEVYKHKKVWNTVCHILKEIVQENKTQKTSKDIIEKQKKLSFYSKNPASVSLSAYVERILKYTHIEESTLVIALIYIDRLCEKQNLILTDNNIHRIVFTAIVLAIKYNEDDYYSNNYYSKVGGVSVSELNTFEIEFVKLIKYNCFVKSDVFDKYKIYLSHYQVKTK